MFSTCLFCHASLGDNRSIEHFPVGRRLAFDAERGRLWAVCPRCARWNLSPIEARWEAVEECERAYRGAKQRVSTDHIALARLGDGTDLVRIGRPLFPEFAAWRYGREFIKRSWRFPIVASAPQLAAMVALFAAARVSGALIIAPVLGAGLVPAAAGGLGLGFNIARARNPSALLFMHDGAMQGVSQHGLSNARLRRDEFGTVALRLKAGVVEQNNALLRAAGFSMRRARGAELTELDIAGPVALDLLRRTLPLVNITGGRSGDVADAVSILERGAPSLPGEGPTAHLLLSAPGIEQRDRNRGVHLGSIDAGHRLAAEMALHEADERLAMSGELGALYARWEEAERTAKIADALSLSLQSPTE